ncbi:MAG TPA: CpaF family protein [bacterium]|nr:CpaF family protein [bacterium]
MSLIGRLIDKRRETEDPLLSHASSSRSPEPADPVSLADVDGPVDLTDRLLEQVPESGTSHGQPETGGVPPSGEAAFDTASASTPEELYEYKQRVQNELLSRVNRHKTSFDGIGEQEFRSKVREIVVAILSEPAYAIPPGWTPQTLLTELLDDFLDLGPLEKFLGDDTITEIMVNRPDQIYIERGGRIELSGERFLNEDQVRSVIQRIIQPLGRHVDESVPYVDARLPDGSRVHVIIPPLALHGAKVTIRKFFRNKLNAEDLLRLGTISRQMVKFLELMVKYRANILISGGSGSGKTTLLNVLSNYIPDNQRIITIEDAAELQINKEHVISLESRAANTEGTGAVSIRELVRNTLRMRPDRIVVGECRGGEALDMLQAMNTGHDGSLTTIHANSPRDTLSRLETLVLMAGVDLPSRVIREQVASAIDMIVQTARQPDGSRKITHITEVSGLGENAVFLTQEIFLFKQQGVDATGRIIGRYVPTGTIPAIVDRLRARGVKFPMEVFAA